MHANFYGIDKVTEKWTENDNLASEYYILNHCSMPCINAVATIRGRRPFIVLSCLYTVDVMMQLINLFDIQNNGLDWHYLI